MNVFWKNPKNRVIADQTSLDCSQKRLSFLILHWKSNLWVKEFESNLFAWRRAAIRSLSFKCDTIFGVTHQSQFAKRNLLRWYQRLWTEWMSATDEKVSFVLIGWRRIFLIFETQFSHWHGKPRKHNLKLSSFVRVVWNVCHEGRRESQIQEKAGNLEFRSGWGTFGILSKFVCNEQSDSIKKCFLKEYWMFLFYEKVPQERENHFPFIFKRISKNIEKWDEAIVELQPHI